MDWQEKATERQQKERAALLHKAEETGQSRELRAHEVGAVTLMSAVETVTLALGAAVLVIIVRGSLSWGTIGAAVAIGVCAGGLALYVNIMKNFAELRDGLCSYRSIETYAPPVVPPGGTSDSPIVVRPYGGDPYILSGNERLALPDGRQTRLGLNPPTMTAVLQEVITKHEGQWSRSRLMGIRVNGQRITRKLYEELTDTLTRSGFLLPQPRGGYVLPPDVHEFEDVVRYLPNLVLGRRDGRREGGKGEDISLAERRKREWLEKTA